LFSEEDGSFYTGEASYPWGASRLPGKRWEKCWSFAGSIGTLTEKKDVDRRDEKKKPMFSTPKKTPILSV